MEFTSSENKSSSKKRGGVFAKLVRVEVFVVLFFSALLLAALSVWLASSNTIGGQSKEVNSANYQAVFLNIGQVYFGKIASLNDKYMVLNDVFYVNCNTGTSGNSTCQQNGNNTYTLYKLGVNELHAPQDKMVINQSQVAYWENLKDSGKVVQAINQYKKNPNAANSQVQSTPSTSGTGQSTSGQ
jgi:hypothetical protein